MGYKLWNEYGYGICVDDVYTSDMDKVFKLIHMAPNFEETFYDWIHETFGEEDNGTTVSEILTADDLEDYEDNNGYHGLAAIINAVICECEKITFGISDDYNGVYYLLYYPCYPWSITEKEKDLTEEKLRVIFSKYVSVLVDKPVEIGFKDVECGG